MNLSISWICPERRTTQRPTTSATPTTALRSERKTSGLFDTCGTDVTDGKVASAESLAQHCTDLISSDLISNNDLISSDLISSLPSFPDAGVIPELGVMDAPGVSAPAAVAPGVDTLEASFGNEGFCEVFTDLTDFLLESVGPVEAPEKAGSTRKRTATEALLDAMENEVVSTAIMPTSPVIDHTAYTLKPQKKRARTSTVTSESAASEAESYVSVASTSTARSSMTCAEKQAERRVKNNIASRRSRQTRKQKFTALEEEAVELQKKNKELAATVEDLQVKVKKMKDELIKRLAKR